MVSLAASLKPIDASRICTVSPISDLVVSIRRVGWGCATVKTASLHAKKDSILRRPEGSEPFSRLQSRLSLLVAHAASATAPKRTGWPH
jgi:hypothetical protein